MKKEALHKWLRDAVSLGFARRLEGRNGDQEVGKFYALRISLHLKQKNTSYRVKFRANTSETQKKEAATNEEEKLLVWSSLEERIGGRWPGFGAP